MVPKLVILQAGFADLHNVQSTEIKFSSSLCTLCKSEHDFMKIANSSRRHVMTYTFSKLLSFKTFWSQYGDDPRYELIDGELQDMKPTGPHESTSGKLVGRFFAEILRLNLK